MPNWCNNTLTISHPDKKKMEEVYSLLCRIEDKDNENETFFGFFMPEPDHEEGPENATPAWYWWRVNNWGTKWDASIFNYEQVDDHTISVFFDTAWGPAIGVYDTMVEDLGFSVEARYFEPGMGFVGTYEDGVDDYYEYSNQSATSVRPYIGEDNDDYWGISTMMEEWEEEEAAHG